MNCLRLSFEDDANGIESMPIRNKNLTRSRGSWTLMVECGSKNVERIGVFGVFGVSVVRRLIGCHPSVACQSRDYLVLSRIFEVTC